MWYHYISFKSQIPTTTTTVDFQPVEESSYSQTTMTSERSETVASSSFASHPRANPLNKSLFVSSASEQSVDIDVSASILRRRSLSRETQRTGEDLIDNTSFSHIH